MEPYGGLNVMANMRLRYGATVVYLEFHVLSETILQCIGGKAEFLT